MQTHGLFVSPARFTPEAPVGDESAPGMEFEHVTELLTIVFG
jgi:hypothetical protein